MNRDRIADVAMVGALLSLGLTFFILTACKKAKVECPGTAPVASQKVSEDEVKVIMSLKPVVDRRWDPPLCFLVSDRRSNEYEDIVVAVPCRAFLKSLPITSPKPVALDHATVIPTRMEKLPAMKVPVPSFKRKKQKRAVLDRIPIVKVPLPEKMQ